MTLMLDDFPLDQWPARVSDRQRFEGGRLLRIVTLRGASDDFETTSALTQALDRLVGATLSHEPVRLRLHPGRSLPVRLRSFTRETLPGAASGAFALELEATHPWEEGDVDTEQVAPVTGNGVATMIAMDGTLAATLRLSFQASSPAMLLQFGDGQHTLSYFGLVPAGSVLVVDAGPRRAWLDGEEVTSQVSGDYLMVYPSATPISVNADMGAPPSGTLTLSWRDRWL